MLKQRNDFHRESKRRAPLFILQLLSRFKKEENIRKVHEIKLSAEKLRRGRKTRVFYNDRWTARNQEILINVKRLWSTNHVIQIGNG